jgi:hypothetical protein
MFSSLYLQGKPKVRLKDIQLKSRKNEGKPVTSDWAAAIEAGRDNAQISFAQEGEAAAGACAEGRQHYQRKTTRPRA